MKIYMRHAVVSTSAMFSVLTSVTARYLSLFNEWLLPSEYCDFCAGSFIAVVPIRSSGDLLKDLIYLLNLKPGGKRYEITTRVAKRTARYLIDLVFLEKGGTWWQYGAHKWYAMGKSFWTAAFIVLRMFCAFCKTPVQYCFTHLFNYPAWLQHGLWWKHSIVIYLTSLETPGALTVKNSFRSLDSGNQALDVS